jgi:hypothetical protein
MSDSRRVTSDAKRYLGITRTYGAVSFVLFAVAGWSIVRMNAGGRGAATSIAIDIALGCVTAGCAVYFALLARKTERVDRGR